MLRRITVMPQKRNIEVVSGENLRQILLREGLAADAPCGGNGSCGKCKVLIDGCEALACRTTVDRDMTVTLPKVENARILTEGVAGTGEVSPQQGCCLAFALARPAPGL